MYVKTTRIARVEIENVQPIQLLSFGKFVRLFMPGLACLHAN
jgi:hypothetical protein